jgi:hypothetical protein
MSRLQGSARPFHFFPFSLGHHLRFRELKSVPVEIWLGLSEGKHSRHKAHVSNKINFHSVGGS